MSMVTVNLAGLTGNTAAGAGITGNKGEGQDGNGQVKNGSIYAGNINNMTNDRIEQKRAMARKQASKAIMDQFAADNEVTDRIKELRTRNTEIKEETSALLDQRKVFTQEQEALKEKYGINPDSEEQKQLDSIRRVRKATKSGDWSGVSEEDIKTVAGMDKTRLTEYQTRSLGYDEVIGLYDSEIEELNLERQMNDSCIRGMKQGLLKTSYKGISKAYKAADKIMDAASKDIIGMAWEDAKKHVEEEFEKLVEAAKEKAEEKKEQEEKLEATKEKKEEQEELTDAIQDSAKDQEKLQKEIDKIVKESELLEEDLKGIVVDGLL